MLWRAGSANQDAGGMIYVAYYSGNWQEYRDHWVDGMPDRAGYQPPSGLIEPRRGFGYVWSNRLGGPSATLGWALQDETGSAFGLVQNFANGAAIIRFPQQVTVFFPDGKRWVR